MHKETYKYVGRLSDGTTVLFERTRWVVDNKGKSEPWIRETTMEDIMEAYKEFKEMMD